MFCSHKAPSLYLVPVEWAQHILNGDNIACWTMLINEQEVIFEPYCKVTVLYIFSCGLLLLESLSNHSRSVRRWCAAKTLEAGHQWLDMVVVILQTSFGFWCTIFYYAPDTPLRKECKNDDTPLIVQLNRWWCCNDLSAVGSIPNYSIRNPGSWYCIMQYYVYFILGILPITVLWIR